LTTSSIRDPGHWRKRGEKLRAIAAEVDDLNLRARLIRIADGYETLAKRAEQRQPRSAEGESDVQG
jgi:hypothetical protein